MKPFMIKMPMLGQLRFTTINSDILIGITGYKDYDLYGLLKSKDGSLTLGALRD
jgi:hypothetical protein